MADSVSRFAGTECFDHAEVDLETVILISIWVLSNGFAPLQALSLFSTANVVSRRQA